jgi:2-keto-4-pentenoate hydratase/2-oxohepta-3-ene-1,7-dioic acid hydratase in catechol pathway
VERKSSAGTESPFAQVVHFRTPGVRTVAAGDTMTIEVEGLGSLTKPVVAA